MRRWTAAQALAWRIKADPLELKRWDAAMGPHLQQAKKDIAGAIAAEQLTVWGALSDVSPQQQVPAERFRRHDVVVDEFGEMVPRFPHKPYHGPRWKHIEFDLEQVQRL